MSSSSRRALVALLTANAQYWPSVAPAVRRELAGWRSSAREIEDERERSLALEKLRTEHFNAEVAATLATLAPKTLRTSAVEAIVAVEVLFDYLDGRTELPSPEPLRDSEELFEPFLEAVVPTADRNPTRSTGPDAYPLALAGRAGRALSELPSIGLVGETMNAAALRCAQAQSRLHAARFLGPDPLRDWAERGAAGTGLGWREYALGSASSVLSVHALIAAATRTLPDPDAAARLDRAYLAIGALITLLDSVVDEAQDAAAGQPSDVISLYRDAAELHASFRGLLPEALARVREAPFSAHHEMTLAGIVAYYTTHPGARSPLARPIARAARQALSPTVWPTVAVMRCWRGAKALRNASPVRPGRFVGGADRGGPRVQ